MSGELYSTAMMTATEIYEEFEGSLLRFAMSLVRDADRADDLVQETFIRAVDHLGLLGRLNHHQRRGWLCRVLKNLFLDEERARRRQQALIERLAQEVPLTSHLAPSVTLQTLFESVPEQYRDLLYQRYVLDMTSDEIGSGLGIPAATVRSRLFLVRKWLSANRTKFM